MASFKSNLDVSAEEFIPLVEIARRKCLQEIKVMLEPIFEAGGRNFDQQLTKAQRASMAEGVNAPRLLGEVIAELSVQTPRRAAMGFRFFKRLRESVCAASSREIDIGLTSGLHQLTKCLIYGPLLTEMVNYSLHTASSDHTNGTYCKEAGDAPKMPVPVSSVDKAFGLLAFINLVITRLNLSENPEDCVSIPPLVSCIDLCLLVGHTCYLHCYAAQNTGITPPDLSTLECQLDIGLVISEKNWTGWLYHLFDSFLQSLIYLNYLLTSLNIRLSPGNWHRGAESQYTDGMLAMEENIFISSSHAAMYPYSECINIAQTDKQSGVYLSVILEKNLTWMRKLLADGSLPQKILRHTVLDSLMTMGELLAVTNATCSKWSSSENHALFEPNSELSEEAEESLVQFMKQSNQLV